MGEWYRETSDITKAIFSFAFFVGIRRISLVTRLRSRFASNVFEVLEAPHEVSRGPLKGAVSAQKFLQGSEMETRELLVGTEEKSISPIRGN